MTLTTTREQTIGRAVLCKNNKSGFVRQTDDCRPVLPVEFRGGEAAGRQYFTGTSTNYVFKNCTGRCPLPAILSRQLDLFARVSPRPVV